MEKFVKELKELYIKVTVLEAILIGHKFTTDEQLKRLYKKVADTIERR